MRNRNIAEYQKPCNDVNCIQQSDRDHQLTLRTRFGKPFLLVTSSKPACRCLLFSLLDAKRWKRENLLHAKKEIGDVCTQVTLK